MLLPDANDGNSTNGIYPVTFQGTGNFSSASVDQENRVLIREKLDKLPEFPGGSNKFYIYVGKNFESPAINQERNIRVYVCFVVEKDGSITDIKVQNDLGYGLAKEAIQVLKSLKTKWVPGMIGSNPMRTSYTLPITIQMN